MRRRLLDTIQGAEIWEEDDSQVWFIADADIDCDGGSNPFNDPYWQPDTTYHHNGKAIDAETVPFVVVPPVVVKRTKGVVMGCRAVVVNVLTLETVWCVVADLGPTFKIGELSPAAAKKVSVNPHPVSGGEERRILLYKIYPDVPAVVNGVYYKLQPYKT